MSEITAENINKLITNDVSQFMKQVMKKKERSQKQKENDAKLKDRLKLYHEQKKQAKQQNENIISVYENTTEVLPEKEETKLNIALDHINDTLEELQKTEISEVIKSKRGRPKKHQHPGPTEIIAASV